MRWYLAKCTDRIVTRYIVGYKKEESAFLLKFLYDHIALSQDIQTRVRWRPGTVVVWDVSHIHKCHEMSGANVCRTVWWHTALCSIGRTGRDAIWRGSLLRQSVRTRRRSRADFWYIMNEYEEAEYIDLPVNFERSAIQSS